MNEKPITQHKKLIKWVKEWKDICTPDNVYWCDGSQAEYDRLVKEQIASGIATKLNEKKRPDCILYRSDPSDVARVENRTYIASEKEEDAGPTNNWIEPRSLKKTMLDLYKGCMKGRTLYVIPFSMGPEAPPLPRLALRLLTPLMLF